MRSLEEMLDSRLFQLGAAEITVSRVLVLVAVLLASVVIARILRGSIERLLGRRREARAGVAYAVGRMVQYLVILVGAIIGFSVVGVDLTALAAVGAILTVGVAFGLQSAAQNFISGLILLLERPVQKGDFIIVGDTVGTVHDISMRATRVVSRDGISIIIPNSKLVSDAVHNQSQPTTVYRVRVKVGVEYGSDTELVRATLREVGRAHPAVRDEPSPVVFFREFGASALEFELAVWLDDPRPEPAVTSDLRFAIDRAFRERGVVIAFPQLDVHVRDDSQARRSRAERAPRAIARRVPVVRDSSKEERATMDRVQAQMDGGTDGEPS